MRSKQSMITSKLGTLLVATVPEHPDSSRLLQPSFPQVDGQPSLIQTRPDPRQSRMACKRSGVRIPIAPPVQRIFPNTRAGRSERVQQQSTATDAPTRAPTAVFSVGISLM